MTDRNRKKRFEVVFTEAEFAVSCKIIRDNETGADKDENIKDNALMEKLCSLHDGFWDFKNTNTRELTHGLHNYPAVMVYPISRNIIRIMNEVAPPTTLLDPFAGSGTVLVEGVIGGIKEIYGNDLNPLAKLMCEVKTNPISGKNLETAYNQLMMAVEYEMACVNYDDKTADYYVSAECGADIAAKDGWATDAPCYLNDYLTQKGVQLSVPEYKNIGYWYKPQVIIDLQIIKNCIAEMPETPEKNFIWLAFSELSRVVSNRRNGEFKMFRMPADKVLSYNPDVKREFIEILKRNIGKMSDFSELCQKNEIAPQISVLSENSINLYGVPDNSVDLVITSPPYGDSRTTVAYGEFCKLSLQWLELDGVSAETVNAVDRNLMGGKKYRNGFEYTLDSETLRLSLEKIKDSDIERAGDVFSFYCDLDEAISAIAKKMKQGGYQFWVVGNRTVKLVNLQTDKILVELSQKYGLTHIHTIDRNIPNKVMPSLNSPTNETGIKAATMTNEHIVILRKQ
ncbi:MAG: hypothetical protein LBI36_04320 [Oscillospiraceae bacterium]|nr:hypothetical protein [Oscillospiraceae bacterium]